MSIGGRFVGTPVARTNEAHSPRGVSTVTLAPVAYLETFPNNGTLGSIVSDLTWEIENGTPTVSGGQCTTTTVMVMRPTGLMATTDQYLEFDFVGGAANTGDFVYIVLRSADGVDVTSSDGIAAFIDGATNAYCEIANYAGGSPLDSATLGPGDHIGTWRLEVEADEARLYRNTVLILTADVSALTWTGLGIGIQAEFNGVTIDNVAYGDL